MSAESWPNSIVQPLLLAHPALHSAVVAVFRRDGIVPQATLTDVVDLLAYAWNRPVELAVIEVDAGQTWLVTTCAQLRQFFQFPLLIVAPGMTEPQRIALLDAGADDVALIPAGLAEIPARCRMLARRRLRQLARDPASAYLCLGDLRLDIAGHCLLLPDEQRVEILPQQTRLLALLISMRGACVSPADLCTHVFGASDGHALQRLSALVRDMKRRFHQHAQAPQIDYVRHHGHRLRLPACLG